jgi:hypothetical protein
MRETLLRIVFRGKWTEPKSHAIVPVGVFIGSFDGTRLGPRAGRALRMLANAGDLSITEVSASECSQRQGDLGACRALTPGGRYRYRVSMPVKLRSRRTAKPQSACVKRAISVAFCEPSLAAEVLGLSIMSAVQSRRPRRSQKRLSSVQRRLTPERIATDPIPRIPVRRPQASAD